MDATITLGQFLAFLAGVPIGVLLGHLLFQSAEWLYKLWKHRRKQ